jgi:hypothetical protein
MGERALGFHSSLAELVFVLGIPPTVAETSQPKRARPGKEIDIKSWNGGFK